MVRVVGPVTAETTTMTIESFGLSILGLCNLAHACGIRDTQTSFELMLHTALALADRNTPQGCSREIFLQMAGLVHDKVRRRGQHDSILPRYGI